MTESKKVEEKKKTVSRRDFLKSGSVAIAAGALGVYASGPTEKALADTNTSYEPSTALHGRVERPGSLRSGGPGVKRGPKKGRNRSRDDR